MKDVDTVPIYPYPDLISNLHFQSAILDVRHHRTEGLMPGMIYSHKA